MREKIRHARNLAMMQKMSSDGHWIDGGEENIGFDREVGWFVGSIILSIYCTLVGSQQTHSKHIIPFSTYFKTFFKRIHISVLITIYHLSYEGINTMNKNRCAF